MCVTDGGKGSGVSMAPACGWTSSGQEGSHTLRLGDGHAQTRLTAGFGPACGTLGINLSSAFRPLVLRRALPARQVTAAKG
jgi:hypothetical protein